MKTIDPGSPTETQISAGGVAFRQFDWGVAVALISVGERPRWQLPKGLVEADESPERAAVREVREETGVEAEVVDALDSIEYWFQATRDGRRTRVHKVVHFFLLAYLRGNVADHDQEVREARWFALDEAAARLAFENERRVLEKARGLIAARGRVGA